MKRLLPIFFLTLALVMSCVGANAQDIGPWYQVLDGSILPDVAYDDPPAIARHEGNSGPEWTTTVVDLGDGNSGLQMVNPGGGYSCWFMWDENNNLPSYTNPQVTLAARFRVDSMNSSTKMDLLHAKPRSFGRHNVPIGICIKEGHFWLIQYACGTIPTDRFFLDLGPVEIGKWNTVYLITTTPPVWPDSPTATCYWNGAKVFDRNFEDDSSNLPTASASECGFGAGVASAFGAGSAVVTFDWVADNFYVIEPPSISTLTDAKSCLDGTAVNIAHAVVTNMAQAEDWYPFCFNIRSSDGASGIRVISSAFVLPGDDVSVQGGLATIEGERVIIAGLTPESVIINGNSGETPMPVAMTNKSSAGGELGAQAAVADDALANPVKMSSGANNIGLYMSIFGKVTAVQTTGSYEDFFYVDDGSGLQDGSGNVGIRCRPPARDIDPYDMPSVGDYVVVNGAMGVRQINGINTRYFWTWSWQLAEP